MRLDTQLSQGFEKSVALALSWIDDPKIPPYVKAKAMDFFAKHRPAVPTENEPASDRDRFLRLMDDMSSLDAAVGDSDAPPAA